MNIDPYRHHLDTLISPAESCFSIQPDDQLELPSATKAIYVGQGGDISVRLLRADADVLFANVASGSILDLRVRAVRASGTTASGIVGLV